MDDEAASSRPSEDENGDERFRLGVHVLSEFVFCQRAGVIAHALEGDDTGEEPDDEPRLGYLPDYDARLIEEELASAWKRMWRFLFGAAVGAVGIMLLGFYVNALLAFALGISCYPLMRWFIDEVQDIGEMGERLWLAKNATAHEPNSELSCPQEVEWWGLQKAGFELARYDEPFRDDSLRDNTLELVGKPRFVLVRGSLRIPVLRKKSDAPDLRPSHLVRLAAYCHLVQVCENAKTPYGLILLGNTYTAIAVPIGRKDLRGAVRSAEEACRVILASRKRDYRTKRPKTRAHCSGCPHGEPREYIEGESETVLYGVSIPPYSPRGGHSDVYHSRCGDRFQWVPPHKFAESAGFSD